MVSLLIEFGADMNAPKDDQAPEGPIDDAASNGAIKVVRWLLDHGAKVNQRVDGITRCFPLTGAVIEGHLDVVKLLVEHGADINAVWADNNALSFAITYGRKEIEAYLRSKGAVEPGEPAEVLEVTAADPVLDHIEKHLGKADQLALREVVPTDPAIAIHRIRMDDQVALVTTGMSDRPMTVPKGREKYQYAELVIYLPADWPLTDKGLNDARNFWPIEWLRRIARYPHDNHTWLGGPSVIFANGEPPKSLAPNTKLSCILALRESSEFGTLSLPDGREIVFYSLFPLYTEERDLEKRKSTEHLLHLFQKHDISTIVDIHRSNVAKLA
jgi:hypothetical protein